MKLPILRRRLGNRVSGLLAVIICGATLITVPQGAQAATIDPSAAPGTQSPSLPAAGTLVSPSGAVIPAVTTQLLEVQARSKRSSYATLTAWLWDGKSWRQVMRVPARVGARGLAPAASRRQGSRTTPSGTFSLGQGFGLGRAPAGTQLPYRVVTAADYWVYDPRDPATYNTWVTGWDSSARWRTSWAERLAGYRSQYRYSVVIDYNHAVTPGQPDTRAGGGIFLHVNGPGATSGCVSVSRAAMTRLLGWLAPSAQPRIVIGSPS